VAGGAAGQHRAHVRDGELSIPAASLPVLYDALAVAIAAALLAHRRRLASGTLTEASASPNLGS
jgi:hypothetical protein